MNPTVVVTVPIARIEVGKSADEPLKVFGWASVSTNDVGELIVDHQGDIIEPAELEAAAYEFTKASGPANVNHRGDDVGQLIESVIFTPEKRQAMGLPEGKSAWWVGYEIDDAATKARVKAGELRELSIEGDAERIPDAAAA